MIFAVGNCFLNAFENGLVATIMSGGALGSGHGKTFPNDFKRTYSISFFSIYSWNIETKRNVKVFVNENYVFSFQKSLRVTSTWCLPASNCSEATAGTREAELWSSRPTVTLSEHVRRRTAPMLLHPWRLPVPLASWRAAKVKLPAGSMRSDMTYDDPNQRGLCL